MAGGLSRGNILSDNEQAADLAATIRHEMAHALGFNVITVSVQDKSGKEMEDADGVPILKFPEDIAQDNAWTYHLRDQNLNPAAMGYSLILAVICWERVQNTGGRISAFPVTWMQKTEV